jgi:hypothetical protein
MEHREIELADCSGQLWLEGGGAALRALRLEAKLRSQWYVAQIVQAVKAQGARMEERSLCFCLLNSYSLWCLVFSS